MVNTGGRFSRDSEDNSKDFYFIKSPLLIFWWPQYTVQVFPRILWQVILPKMKRMKMWKLNAMIQLNSEIESSLFLGARNCLSGWAVGQYYLSIPLLLVASIKLNLWSHWSVPLRTCPLLIMYSKGWPWTFGKHPAAQSCEACAQTPLLARLTGWRSEPQARLQRGDPGLNKQKYISLFLTLKSQTTYTAHTIPSKCIFI